MFGMAFYGEGGTMVLDGGAWKILDDKGKEVTRGTGGGSEIPHLENFFQAVRGSGTLNAEIEVGHRSTLLCHLGNIAYRTSRTLHLDPASGRILRDPEAARLWGREYREGWKPKV